MMSADQTGEGSRVSSRYSPVYANNGSRCGESAELRSTETTLTVVLGGGDDA
jgi:hypothetical protein